MSILHTLVLPVLKKNYARLCHCLPQDYVKTVHKLKQLIPEVSADYLAWLRTLPSTDLINEAIIGNVMCAIRADYGVFEFCDVIENLCDEVTSRNLIGALRNGKLTSYIRELNLYAVPRHPPVMLE